MDIHKPFVITVSRELGSGGRTVGRKLAEKLGVRYCDKDLINTLRQMNYTPFKSDAFNGYAAKTHKLIENHGN